VPNLFERVAGAWNALVGRAPASPPASAAPPAPDPGIPSLNIPHVSGWSGGRIISTTNPEEVMRAIAEAQAEGPKLPHSEGLRVSLNVHDKNGWHQLFVNPAGPGRHRPEAGMTASELYQRLERNRVPGTREDQLRHEREHPEDAGRSDQLQGGGRQAPTPPALPVREPAPAPTPPLSQPAPAAEPAARPGLGERVRGFFGGLRDRVASLFGGGQEREAPAPEPGERGADVESDGASEDGREGEDFPDDFLEDWDEGYGAGEGSDEDETEGYDVYSVGGYQVVIYY
jgi:hypothetical protein